MELGGDDLEDDLFIDESIVAAEEDEPSPLIPGISQDSEESEDDRVALSNAAESALLLAKKRKRKAKEKEKKAKVRSCGEYIFILIIFERRSGSWLKQSFRKSAQLHLKDPPSSRIISHLCKLKAFQKFQ